jgi:hypothetical protein
MNRVETMYEYYRLQDVMPTFADFRDEAGLRSYEEARRRLLLDKLFVPLQFFRKAEVLQYGPDTGEDALVYARWGARLTLVEPNPRALPIIREYFSRFGLESHLSAIEQTTVEAFAAERRFDLIDAEGFIETVQPTSMWLERFSRHLKNDGFFLINFYETTGAFVELCTKALYRAGRVLRPQDSEREVARELFWTKWDAIPHTRAFESWVMDVLENPWVFRAFTLDAARFCDEAAEHGFELYSSWPMYREPLEVYWHKRIPDYAALREQGRRHIKRSKLSFLTGKKLYLVDDDSAAIDASIERLGALGVRVDRLAAAYDPQQCAEAAVELRGVRREVAALRTFSDPPVRAEALELLDALARGFDAASGGDWIGLCSLTNTDQVFIRNWGMPCHLAVFRRLPG